MEQPTHILKAGTRIKTHEKLEGTKGMVINPVHLSAREPNQAGAIVHSIAGHGGDV